jgi:hypothetical protein
MARGSMKGIKMSYKVLDPNGVGYSCESGVIVIPKGGILEDKLILENLFRQEAIDGMIKDGRLESVSGKKVIAPDNMKMPIVETKKESKKTKGK